MGRRASTLGCQPSGTDSRAGTSVPGSGTPPPQATQDRPRTALASAPGVLPTTWLPRPTPCAERKQRPGPSPGAWSPACQPQPDAPGSLGGQRGAGLPAGPMVGGAVWLLGGLPASSCPPHLLASSWCQVLFHSAGSRGQGDGEPGEPSLWLFLAGPHRDRPRHGLSGA